jgi:DNA-binding FrmR family transcriptional regulator
MTETAPVRHKVRTAEQKQELTCRLNRIEGQIRGLNRMVQDDRYCVDILTQVSSVQAALNSFNRLLLESHIQSCVVDDIKAGRQDAVAELCGLLEKTMK